MKNIHFEIRQNSLSIMFGVTLAPTPHIHKELELIYVKKGQASAHVDNKIYELSDGDILLCFPNQVHYYLNSVIGEYLVGIFSPAILYNMQNTFADFIPKSNVFKIYDSRLTDSFYEKDIPYQETVWAGLLNQLIPSLLANTELIPKMNIDSSAIESILSYCNENFTEDISLDDIAKKLHISKNHVSYLFNKKLNIRFNQYINSLRINKACSLMGTGDKSLAFISEESGFGSIRSFNRAFRQIMGICPLEYHKKVAFSN